MELRFERCRREHLEGVHKIERESFSDPWSLKAFEEVLENPHVTFTLCFDGDALAGYVIGMGVAPEGEIANIAVAPAYRRRSIGRALLDNYVSGATDTEIFFLEVREGNIPARALYEGYGFSVLGVRKNYYKNPRENAIVMVYSKKQTNTERQ